MYHSPFIPFFFFKQVVFELAALAAPLIRHEMGDMEGEILIDKL